MNPFLPLPLALAAGVTLLVTAVWSGWRSSLGRSRGIRVALTGLRAAAAAMLGLLLLNPGTWERPAAGSRREWRLLVDRSLSMAREDAPDRKSRFGAVAETVRRFADGLARDEQLLVTPFAAGLEPPVSPDALGGLVPDGTQSAIVTAVADTLAQYETRPNALRGVVLLSDGVCVPSAEPAAVAERALAMCVPIHVVPVGGPVRQPDLHVSPRRTVWTVFSGQRFELVFDVHTRAMDSVAVPIELSGPGYSRETTLRLAGEADRICRFEVTAPAEAGQHLYECRAPVQAGESDLLNNSAQAVVQVLDSKLDVLLVEGLPHWDSKFLAQVLRTLDYVDLTELYRLGPERFHCINPNGEPKEGRALAENPQAILGFDVVVLGKAADSVLKPEVAEAVVNAVADGGVLICARGNAARGETWAPGRITPAVWRPDSTAALRWQATVTGGHLGLFGERLPGVHAPLWGTLPPVPRVAVLDSLSPYALVLAEAVGADSDVAAPAPLLVARRWGRGLCVTVGAEGLWQWDFFPKERAASTFYRDFWPQLIQWALQFNDCLPGQAFSLRTPQAPMPMNHPVPVAVLARKTRELNRAEASIAIHARDDSGNVLAGTAAPTTDGVWEGTLTFTRPGLYTIEADTPDRETAGGGPHAAIQVLPEPQETSELSANPEFLARLARESGGYVIEIDGAPELPLEADAAHASLQDTTDLVWRPWWDHVVLLAAALGCFLFEWYLRRRHMLA